MGINVIIKPTITVSIAVGLTLFLLTACSSPTGDQETLPPSELPILNNIPTQVEATTPPQPLTESSPQQIETTIPPTYPPTHTIQNTAAVQTPTRQERLPTITLTPTYGYPENINPLTGGEAPIPEKLDRRPILVKVSNYPRIIRPQAGLSFADMIFEYYIGEGANRFLAVYYSQDPKSSGPIRSGRLADIKLAEMYQGIIVYGGADDRINEVYVRVLSNRAVDTRHNHPCPPICGELTHSIRGVFVNTEALSAFTSEIGINNTRPILDGMHFNYNPPQAESFGEQIGIQFSSQCRSEWHFDTTTQRYYRWTEENSNLDMIPHVDKLTDQQISVSNVLILFSDYVIYTPTMHDIEIWRNTAGKRAVLYRDGLTFEGTWKTVHDTQPIQFFNQDGEPMSLKPGPSWIIFATEQSSLEQNTAGEWEMQFYLP